jgi:hypothetical protein
VTHRRARLVRAGALLAAAGCAQMDPPPGGPEDRTPPAVIAVRPDSFALVPDWDSPVVIEFSERISERQVEEAVMVSPRTSPVAVERGSREVRVSLRRGWEPGQIYHVAVRPLIQDLFNNRVTEPVQVVFSTGPEIPATLVSGTVVDRISGEPEEDARVEAIRSRDSLVYAVPSDSVGRFVLAHIPEGDYLLRAFPDQNRNRLLDSYEKRDSLAVSVTVAADTAGATTLSLVMPDSTPPQLLEASADAERRVELRFDDYLDPAQPVDSTTVTLVGPDGANVPIASVTVGRPPEQPADTAAAAPDTVAALPSQLLVAALAEGVELVPEAEYRVSAAGVRNVVGLVGAADTTFTAPAPPPPPEPEPEPEPAQPDTIPDQPAQPAREPEAAPEQRP